MKIHHLGDGSICSSNSQEHRNSVVSHSREKLDNFKPYGSRDDHELEDTAEAFTQGDNESLQLSGPKFDLRKSLAWDSAFFTSPGVLDPDELFERVKARAADNSTSVLGPREHVYLSSDSLEPEITSRIGKCNLRRSLAWDSGFFTNAGVLDPDELCIINKGLKKSETRGLPGIEKLQRSVESNSTMDRDSFSLESLEYGLFEGIRMSQQKSSKASNVASSRCNLGKGTASKKLDASSRSRMKPMSAATKLPVNMHGLERNTKEASAHARGPRVQSTARSADFNPYTLKPPKIVRRANLLPAAPSKKATSGANHIKMEDNSTKDASDSILTGKHMTASKKQCLRNSYNVIPISKSYPKSPRLGSSTPVKGYAESCSPYRTVNTAPDGGFKSPSTYLRRKTDSINVTDGSTPCYPLRYSARNRAELSNSSCRSSCTSLASSIDSPLDGWSSESSSTILVSQKSDICKKSLDTDSRGISVDRDATQTSDRKTMLPSQHYKEVSARNSPDFADISRNCRPSGLRMPSPKLGFFDGVNSLLPNGGLHYKSDLQHAELPATRTSTETENTKFGSQKTGVLSPAANLNQLETVENATSKASPVPGTLRSYLSRTAAKDDRRSLRNKCSDNHSEAENVGTAVHNAAAAAPPENDPRTSPKAKTRGTETLRKKKVQRVNKGQACANTRKQSLKRHAREGNENEKENLFRFEDQVNSLSKHIGFINLRGDVVMELK